MKGWLDFMAGFVSCTSLVGGFIALVPRFVQGVLIDATSSTNLNECVNFERVRGRVIPYTMQ